MSFAENLIRRFATLWLSSKLQRWGTVPGLILSFLPFFGIAWFGWSAAPLVISFFVDRLFLMFYSWLTGFISEWKTEGVSPQLIVRRLAILYVLSQLLGGLGVFAGQMMGVFNSPESRMELIEISLVIGCIYTVQWIVFMRSYDWTAYSKKQETIDSMKAVLLGGAIFMIALFAGIFLRNPISETYLAPFFQSGMGITIFVLTVLRVLSDRLFAEKKETAKA